MLSYSRYSFVSDSSLWLSIVRNCPFSWLFCIPLFEYIIIYPFCCWYMLSFHLRAIINGAAINILVHVFWWKYVWISIEYIPSCGHSALIDTVDSFLKLYQFALLSASYESSHCSTIPTTFGFSFPVCFRKILVFHCMIMYCL